MFPTSTSINACGIGEGFESCHLLCGQLNLGSLSGLDSFADTSGFKNDVL